MHKVGVWLVGFLVCVCLFVLSTMWNYKEGTAGNNKEIGITAFFLPLLSARPLEKPLNAVSLNSSKETVITGFKEFRQGHRGSTGMTYSSRAALPFLRVQRKLGIGLLRDTCPSLHVRSLHRKSQSI